jgi:hypothetical protein
MFPDGGVGRTLADRPLNEALQESARSCHGEGGGAEAVFASLAARMFTPFPFERRRGRLDDILACRRDARDCGSTRGRQKPKTHETSERV